MAKRTHEGAHGTHSYTHDELESTMNFINSRLGGDPQMSYLLPLDDPEGIFDAMKDGVILSKLINIAVPETIDERTINLPASRGLNPWQTTENHNLVINSAKGIGCKITNIGTHDITAGTPHLVLGMVWQIIKIGLMRHINLKEHPELIALLEDGETLQDFLALPPEQILLRWFNYQLKKAGEPRRVHNFGRDIKDSHCYTKLLKQISRGQCNESPLNESDPSGRAEKMLQEADKLGCREFVFPSDVVAGREQLNFCFTANLFNKYPALDDVDPDDFADMDDFDSEGSREERAFRYWMQSLGFNVDNLYTDLRDGLILLKLIDVIKPGTVNWSRVSDPPKNKFAAVGNTNMVVQHGREDLGMSTVGIGGPDLYDGNKKLTLAIVWQMMKAHQLAMLNKVGGGRRIEDAQLVEWGNSKVSAVPAIRSFKDQSLGTGEFLVHLCAGVSPRSVDTSLIETGSDEAYMNNAKYAISCARKIGAVVFLLPEDVVEVKHKMILTFFAALMYKELHG